MANSAIKGITVEIGGDTTKLGKALGDTEKKSRSLQVELRQIEKLLKFDPTNTDLLAQKQDVLTNSIEETSEKLKTLKEAEAQVIAQFERGEIAENQLRAFQREIMQTEKELNGLKSELSSTETAIKGLADETNDAEKHTDEYKQSLADANEELANFKEKASNAFDVLKTGAGILGGAVVATGGYALKLSTDFDKAFNTLITKTGASKEEMDGLNTAMENVYANNFGESIEDVANSMATVMQNTKLSGDELQNATERAILLRDTFEFDVNESTRSAKMLMDQFGISADEAYNLIAQGAQSGLDKNGDLLDSINEYAVHYKQLGFSAEGFFNSLAKGTDAGTFSVDKLGDAMKEFGIRVKDTSDATYTTLNQLGYGAVYSAKDFEATTKQIEKLNSELNKTSDPSRRADLELQIKDYKNFLKIMTEENVKQIKLNGTVDDLQTTIANGGEESQKAIQGVLEKLFAIEDPIERNSHGVALFGTMWEDLGEDGIKALMDVNGGISLTSSALDDINNQKYDDIGSALQGLGRTLETDVIKPLGEELKPVVEEAIGYVQANGPAIKDVLSGVVSAVGDFVGFIVDNGPTILSVIAGIGAGMLVWNVASVINSVVGAIKAYQLANEGATVAQALFNAVLNANPLMLIITVITAVVVALVTFIATNEDVRKKFVKIWNAVKKFASDTWNSIKNTAITVWNAIKTGVSNAINSAKNTITTIVNSIKSIVSNVWNAIRSTTSSVFNSVKSTITSVVNSIKSTISSVWNSIKSTTSSIFNSIKSTMSNAINSAKSSVVNTCKNIFTGMKNAFSNVKNTFKSIGTNVIEGIKSGIKGAVSGLYSSIKSALGGLVDKAKDALDINSPSKVFANVVGKAIPEGIAKGVNDNTDIADSAIHDMTDDLSNQALSLNGATLNRKLTTTFSNGSAETGVNGKAFLDKLDGIYERLNRLQIVLDTGTLVGETIDKIDRGLATRQTLTARGV